MMIRICCLMWSFQIYSQHLRSSILTTNSHLYCEANDLISIPSLELDPVSKQLDGNTTAINSLSAMVRELPSKFVQPIIEQTSSNVDSLKGLVESVQRVREQLTATISAAVKDLSAARVLFIDASFISCCCC